MRSFAKFERFGKSLASPYLTLLFFLLMGAGSLLVTRTDVSPTAAVILPLLLLMINLGASILTYPRFRIDLSLLIFHLALVAFVILLLIARLTYFEGFVNLTSNALFEGNLERVIKGPFHNDDPQTALRFTNEGFTENFPDRGKYLATYNRVRWWDEAGNSHVVDIGDDRPLILKGYRIYTTKTRGFAPMFMWEPLSGTIEMGMVQLRDSGLGGFTPDSGWMLPMGPEMWAMVEPDVSIESPPPNSSRANFNAETLNHKLVIRIAENRYELQKGASIDIPEGKLTYTGLRSWMGYRIVYDPTIPWLISTIIIAVGALGWFYWKLFRRPKRTITHQTELN